MLLPGLSNPRLPVYFRVLLAMTLTSALLPAVGPKLAGSFSFGNLEAVLVPAAKEITTGLAFGFWGMCFLQASRLAASTIASTVGLAGVPGAAVDEFDPNSTLASFLTMASTMLILSADLHLTSLGALVRSYEAIPFSTGMPVELLISVTGSTIRDTTLFGLQIASPFIVYSVVVNLALGLCSKFTPQLQVYFATMGLTILLALALLATDALNTLEILVLQYRIWLENIFQ